MLGYQVDEMAAALRMPPRTIKCYVSKVLHLREMKANTIGRPIKGVSMHVEFFIMEVVLKHPEKTRQNLSNNDGNGNDKATKQ